MLHRTVDADRAEPGNCRHPGGNLGTIAHNELHNAKRALLMVWAARVGNKRGNVEGIYAMHMIYNSPQYCVVEFRADDGQHHAGYEIMDKRSRREIFLGGTLADRFKSEVQHLIQNEPSVEEIDAFLSQFEGLMLQPLTLH